LLSDDELWKSKLWSELNIPAINTNLKYSSIYVSLNNVISHPGSKFSYQILDIFYPFIPSFQRNNNYSVQQKQDLFDLACRDSKSLDLVKALHTGDDDMKITHITIMIAITGGHLPIVKYVSQHRLNFLRITGEMRFNIYESAVKCGNHAILEYIIRKYEINLNDPYEIELVIIYGTPQMLKIILDRYRRKDDELISINYISLALKKPSPEMVNILLYYDKKWVKYRSKYIVR